MVFGKKPSAWNAGAGTVSWTEVLLEHQRFDHLWTNKKQEVPFLQPCHAQNGNQFPSAYSENEKLDLL